MWVDQKECPMTLPLAGDPYLPSYLPQGYRLSQRVEGPAAQGFGLGEERAAAFRFTEEQLAYVFRNGNEKEAWVHPLTVHLGSDPDWSLTATEHRRGEPVQLPGVSAVYHDGMWTPAEAGGQDAEAPGGLTWVKNGTHSLTVRWSGGVWAARGSRRRGVSQADLVRMARSVAFA
jgi:hypothetical protein